MKNTVNAITMQDEFIATVSRYRETNRNYYALVSKASKKLRAAAMEIGFNINAADQMVADAYDMAVLQRRSAA